MSAAEQVTPPASNSRSLIERAWSLAGLSLFFGKGHAADGCFAI